VRSTPASRPRRGSSRNSIRCRRSAKPALAQRERVSRSYFTRLVRLSYLAPDITQAILDGQQPRDLTADKLLEHSRLPLAWHDQRTVLGFA
jgi:site-specific DNA recombinase